MSVLQIFALQAVQQYRFASQYEGRRVRSLDPFIAKCSLTFSRAYCHLLPLV